MEKNTKDFILDHVFKNTEPEAFENALKNFNIRPLIDTHKATLISEFFGGDGIKYSEGIKELTDEFLTAEDVKNAQRSALDERSLHKDKSNPEYKAAVKAVNGYSKKLEPLRKLYEKANEKES